MPITFNGDITVNGKMEVYGDGSVRISENQETVTLDELKDLIKQTTVSNREKYIEAVGDLKTSTDKAQVGKAFLSLLDFAKISGRAFWINGLSTIAQEVAKSLVQHK